MPLFDPSDDHIPTKKEVENAAEYFQGEGLVESHILSEHFWIELTHAGKKRCEKGRGEKKQGRKF